MAKDPIKKAETELIILEQLSFIRLRKQIQKYKSGFKQKKKPEKHIQNLC